MGKQRLLRGRKHERGHTFPLTSFFQLEKMVKMVNRRKGYAGEREIVERIEEVYDPAWIERLAVSGVGGFFPDVEFVKDGVDVGIEVKRTKKEAETFYNNEDHWGYKSTIKWAELRREEGLQTVALLGWRPDYHTTWRFFEIEDIPRKLRVKLSKGFTIEKLEKYWS